MCDYKNFHKLSNSLFMDTPWAKTASDEIWSLQSCLSYLFSGCHIQFFKIVAIFLLFIHRDNLCLLLQAPFSFS